MPSSSVVTLRFPRSSEYHLSEAAPNVGDVLVRNGDSWVVEDVHDAEDGSIVVTLGPGSGAARGASGETRRAGY